MQLSFLVKAALGAASFLNLICISFLLPETLRGVGGLDHKYLLIQNGPRRWLGDGFAGVNRILTGKKSRRERRESLNDEAPSDLVSAAPWLHPPASLGLNFLSGKPEAGLSGSQVPFFLENPRVF